MLQSNGPDTTPFSLFDISYVGGAMQYSARTETATDDQLAGVLADAHSLLGDIDPHTAPAQPELDATASFEDLRWFLLPDEIRSGG